MSTWCRERDFLPGGFEQVIPAATTLDAAVRRIMSEAGLPPADTGRSSMKEAGTVSGVRG